MGASDEKFRLRYTRGRVKFWEKVLALLSDGKLEDLAAIFEEKRAKAEKDLEELSAQEATKAAAAEKTEKAELKAAEKLEKIRW